MKLLLFINAYFVVLNLVYALPKAHKDFSEADDCVVNESQGHLVPGNAVNSGSSPEKSLKQHRGSCRFETAVFSDCMDWVSFDASCSPYEFYHLTCCAKIPCATPYENSFCRDTRKKWQYGPFPWVEGEFIDDPRLCIGEGIRCFLRPNDPRPGAYVHPANAPDYRAESTLTPNLDDTSLEGDLNSDEIPIEAQYRPSAINSKEINADFTYPPAGSNPLSDIAAFGYRATDESGYSEFVGQSS